MVVKLTETQGRALRILQRRSSWSASEVGAELWSTGERQPQHYARPAGRVLWQLERLGLVAYGRLGWSLTAWGKAEAARL